MTKRERRYHKRKGSIYFANYAGYLWPGKQVDVQLHMKDGSIYEVPATILPREFPDNSEPINLGPTYKLTVTPTLKLFAEGKVEFDLLDQPDAE